MMVHDCPFCDEQRTELPTAIKICDLPHSRLYLFRDQLYAGRCLLASKAHAAEIYRLPPEEKNGFLDELAGVAQALEEFYKADKMNFLSLGDTAGHIHMHLVPKKKSDSEWGSMFRFMTETGHLSDEVYWQRIEEIRTVLRRKGLLDS